ncbi:hypothetical protein KYB31_09250 [Clostridium felsineum]|uniref:hypothetical protein n=1 Tax=Clostridium felsineum TaxID=36839 RepID=UPI00214DE933|nr:hypothetical protein [Clostridium felsineum]MCR3759175.1 hypothetical protein [Clostridium felsineum]
MCKYCKKAKTIKVSHSDSNQPNEAIITQNDVPGIVLLRAGCNYGYFDIKYCPMCGRKLGDVNE